MRKNSRWASSAHFMSAKDSALGSNLGLRISAFPHLAPSFGRGSRESQLMGGFQDLKRTLRDIEGMLTRMHLYHILMNIIDVSVIELPVILSPFFAIVRSPLSTGPITAAALSALHSFFVCGLISSSSIALETALVEISSAVSHCKFEASDSSGDEVVLLKIMAVIQDCLCGSVGKVLGDIEVCEMLETVLTTCCQMRLSGEWDSRFILIL